MKAEINSISGGSKHILLAHGFLGTPQDWDFLLPHLKDKYTVHLLTLPGHESAPIDENVEEFFSTLDQFVQKHSGILLLGYSMGSRILMEIAVRNLSSFSQLIVESGNPGIENESERINRYQQDCSSNIAIDFKKFLADWYELPLFHSLSLTQKNELIKVRSKLHSPEKLFLAQKLFSPGIRPNLWPQMAQINGTYISGELDNKYTQIGKRLQGLGWQHEVIVACGHNTHLEAKKRFLDCLLPRLI